jgi:hypothetical protein
MRQDKVSLYRTLRELYVNGAALSRGSRIWRQWLCISLSTGLLSFVIRWKFTDVSKESAASFFKEHLRHGNIRAHSCPAGDGSSMSLRARSRVHYRIHNSLTFVIVRRHKNGLHIPTGGTTPETTWIFGCSIGFVSRFLISAFCGPVVLVDGHNNVWV